MKIQAKSQGKHLKCNGTKFIIIIKDNNHPFISFSVLTLSMQRI